MEMEMDRKRKRSLGQKRQGLGKDKGGKSRKCWCCRKLVGFLFSHVGLCALVVGYSFLGAFVFRALEGPYERQRASEVISMRKNTVVRLWNITENFNVLYFDNWTAMVSKEMILFQEQLIQAVRDGYDGKGQGQGQGQDHGPPRYGNIAPKTSEGKMVTIVYAIVGIPLMLLFLTNVGNILAKGFRCLYSSCCSCSNGDPNSDHPSSAHHHAHHSHHHLHDHYHVHHIALNDVNPNQGHVTVHCNSNSDPYRTKNCYPTGNSCNATVPSAVGPGLGDVETKLCSGVDIPDHHNCTGTLPRGGHHSHVTPHSTLLRGDHHHHHPVPSTVDYINSGTPVASVAGNPLQQQYHQPHNTTRSTKKVTVPITLCLLLITGYICLGAFMFYAWEGWTFLDGSYFCFVTLSTIGFGDLVPGKSVLNSTAEGSQKKLIICAIYLLGGMALIAMCFNLVQDQVLVKLRTWSRILGLAPDDEEDEEDNLNLAVVPSSHPMDTDDDFDV